MMTKKGIALKYLRSDNAPRVVAKAKGCLLEKLLKTAEENNIPIMCNGDLTEALYQVDLFSEIPEETYMAAAEIIAYCYRLNKDVD